MRFIKCEQSLSIQREKQNEWNRQILELQGKEENENHWEK